MVDLQRKQVEKRLLEDGQDQLITKATSQVQIKPATVEDQTDLLMIRVKVWRSLLRVGLVSPR